MKTCTTCGVDKPLEAFHRNKNKHDGRTSRCGECANIAIRKWRVENPDVVKRCAKEYREKNREKASERTREWQKAHPEKVSSSKARWYFFNREKIREKQRLLRRANPEIARRAQSKRRSLKNGYQGEHYTAADVAKLLLLQDDLCYYCDMPMSGLHTIDHIVPLSRGGGNGPDNIVASCRSCNASKGKRLLHLEWIPPNEKAESLQFQSAHGSST